MAPEGHTPQHSEPEQSPHTHTVHSPQLAKEELTDTGLHSLRISSNEPVGKMAGEGTKECNDD